MEYVEFDRATISNTTEMYAIVDSHTGDLIFNAKGGLYRKRDKVIDKLNRLRMAGGDHYEIVTYSLNMIQIEKDDLMDFLNR